MKRISGLIVGLLLCITSVPAGATIYDIPVTTAGDRVWNWDKSSSYVFTWWTVDANPNQVSHYYDYDNRSGYYADTHLTFDLSPIAGTITDFLSASLNLNILSIWTNGRDDIGTLNTGGVVSYSGGTGWKGYDVTSLIAPLISANSTTANFSIIHTGFSGFTFSSAEGGQPAFLRIATNSPNPVPEPSTLVLLGVGLAGVLFARKRSN